MKTHHDMELGSLVMTRELDRLFKTNPAFSVHVKMSFERFLSHDWGDCDKEDKNLNDMAAAEGGRIVAAYTEDGKDEGKIWIITEADRSLTTFLFPHEY